MTQKQIIRFLEEKLKIKEAESYKKKKEEDKKKKEDKSNL